MYKGASLKFDIFACHCHKTTYNTMKQYFYLLLTCMLLTGCQQDSEQGNTSDALRQNGTAAPAQVPNQSREANLLITDFWVFEYFVVQGDREATAFNRGRWHKFYEDGTYEAGHWQERTDNGTWFLRQGQNYPALIIDSQVNDAYDSEYQLQAVNGAGDAMSWVRTKKRGEGYQAACKVIKMLSRPTKEQFGIE